MEKIAVYSGTRNLYPMMVPAMKSLVANTTVDKIYLLIEDDEFPLPVPEFVESINISDQKWFPEDGPNMKSPFTYMALCRAALCHIFPDVDTILSLDVDTIFLNPCSEIWDFPLEDRYYFCAALEHNRSFCGLMYCNIGVCLYNLKLLRETGKADEVIYALNHQAFNNVEQDAMSYLCQGRILEMPSDYNVSNWTKETLVKKVYHYAAVRDWTTRREYLQYKHTSWEDILARR